MACCNCCIGVSPVRPPINVNEQSESLKVSVLRIIIKITVLSDQDAELNVLTVGRHNDYVLNTGQDQDLS